MKRTIFLISLVMFMSSGAAYGAEDVYSSFKAGVFLPNGKGASADLSSNGLGDFDTGYDLDLAVGFKPATYAAVELGTGFYTAKASVSDAVNNRNFDRTVYGVPVTLTVKGILDYEKFDLYAGAGGGVYFGFMDNSISSTAGDLHKDESSHGTALGYQAVAGVDYKISEKISVGAEFKYFSAKPELQISESASPSITAQKSKWELGGTTLNLGVKYYF